MARSMRIFGSEPSINDFDGFKPEIDIFERVALGEGLTHLVTFADDPLVIAIDADWGTGKSVFLKMWAGELRKLQIPVIYFDAYANDYVDDAFVSLASEIIRLAQQHKNTPRKRVKNLTEKAIGASKILLRSAGKIAAKAATLGALDGSEAESLVKEMSDDLASDASDLADKYLEKLLTGADERRKTLEDFRSALSELPGLLAKNTKKTESGDAKVPPLIFIIDELDRCKPPFALDILERIKHVMSVRNVHFVLGVHIDQLCNSVKAQYGRDIDARTYLQKFIHVTVPLVDTAEHENQSVATKFIQLLSNGMGSAAQSRHVELTNEFMLRYTLRTDLSLRGLEHVYTTLRLALGAANDRTLFIAPLVAGLAVLKLKHPHLYRKAKRGHLRYTEIEKVFGFDDIPENDYDRRSIEWSAGLWKYATEQKPSDEIVREFGRGISQYHISRERVIPMFANDMIDRFKPRQP